MERERLEMNLLEETRAMAGKYLKSIRSSKKASVVTVTERGVR